jgi:hypothetical protein
LTVFVVRAVKCLKGNQLNGIGGVVQGMLLIFGFSQTVLNLIQRTVLNLIQNAMESGNNPPQTCEGVCEFVDLPLAALELTAHLAKTMLPTE